MLKKDKNLTYLLIYNKQLGIHEKSVCKDFLHTAEDGKNYKTKYYNLDAIIAVGLKNYR